LRTEKLLYGVIQVTLNKKISAAEKEHQMKIKSLYRKVTFRFLKMSSLFISTIMGILFGSGCTNSGFTVAYGMQIADYKVSGTVVSSDQNLPVEGLLITVRGTTGNNGQVDSTKTDSFGRYSIEFSPSDSGSTTWGLNIKDIDSTENGSFAAKDTIFSISDSEQKNGYVEKIIDIKLDRME
jgi:putative lipoprotein (rSAM/lipoprotein system)